MIFNIFLRNTHGIEGLHVYDINKVEFLMSFEYNLSIFPSRIVASDAGKFHKL